jgi:penicillin-binding protein 2
MGWEYRGPGDPPPFGRYQDFDEAGDPGARDDEDTHILRPADRLDAQPDEGAVFVPEEDWITQRLPPEVAQRALPKLPRNFGEPKPSRRPLVIALSVVLALALVAGGTAFALRGGAKGTPGKPGGPSCGANTPCKVAQDYLAAYTSGKYEAMYAQTSSASRTRFSDAAILRGNYSDAHDYIVTRTSALVSQADIYEIGATQGAVKQTSDTAASVPVQIEMKSSRLGTITQSISLPLVREGGTWRVDWSPGLIFSKLDDPTYDPHYTRKLHLFTADGSRGTIYDSGGNVLAQDTTVYQIDVVPGQIKNEGTLLAVLSAKLGMSAADIQSAYAGHDAKTPVVIRTVPPQLFTSIQDAINGQGGNGVLVQTTTGRVYPYGTDTAAITGYVSIVTSDDLKNDTQHYYGQGDLVGHAGLEAWGEQYLRPIRGGNLDIVNVNADGTFGQVAYNVAHRDAANGNDIHTTIAIANQQAAMKALRGQKIGKGIGAFGVDPATGAVQMMASWPACDPNDFALGFATGIDACIHPQDQSTPLLNYATQSAVPTGSVLKVVTLAAGFENGVSPTQTLNCPGTYQVPGESVVRTDWMTTGQGTMNAEQALAASCDTIFWPMAVQLNSKDPNLLPNMVKAFGFGTATGVVGVPAGGENAGLAPDPQWLQKTQGKQWTASAAADLGIGQGYFEATPAQVAMMNAALGNNGVRMQPLLVTSVTDAAGKTVTSFQPTQVGKLPISATTLHEVEVGMVEATATPLGTSYGAFQGLPIVVAGKTGTAESGQSTPHAWFGCFAPAAPLSGSQTAVQAQLAIGVLNAYVGHGAFDAAPAARAIVQAYFKV